MSEPGASKGRYLTYGVIFAIIAFFIALSLNQPGGPVADVRGIVESSGYLPSDVGPAVQRASIRLTDGSLIQANVIGAVTVRPGQVAKVRVYRRVITGVQKYEVVGTETAK